MGDGGLARGSKTPHLAGQDPKYLQNQIMQLAGGQRGSKLMRRLLKPALELQKEYLAASPERRTEIEESGEFRMSDEHVLALSLYLSSVSP